MNLSKLSNRILFGISGGIAAYKAPDLLRGWIKAGCEVETILTRSAEQFVSPLALSTLSKRRVWREDDFLSPEYGWQIPHISLTDWADVFVVAPCTGNVLRMCAEGDSETLLGAALLANDKPLVLFPAMNCKMLSNPATRKNIETLTSRGVSVVDPDSGPLACGYDGKGRLPQANVINDYVFRALCKNKDMKGLRVLVTAGPTHEYIDPVRYLSNPSSGKMGYEIARCAWYRGADVTLVSGPVSLVPPAGVSVVNVTSAEQMYEACMDEAADADVIIKAAAVGDFRAAAEAPQKIKRQKGEDLTLTLVQNRDIAAELGRIKKPDQLLVGFAAETQDLLANARKKIASKNLDIIVVNDVLAKGAGFGCDTNSVTIMAPGRPDVKFSGGKDEVADALLDAVLRGRTRG